MWLLARSVQLRRPRMLVTAGSPDLVVGSRQRGAGEVDPYSESLLMWAVVVIAVASATLWLGRRK